MEPDGPLHHCHTPPRAFSPKQRATEEAAMFETSLGPAQHHENLTIFPVLAEKGRELPYLLMTDALAMGTLTIGEKDGGQVPFLLATNAGKESVLILDGEQLIGARQNRMTNRSILLAPESVTEIPVSCMEQGRWHFVGDHFAPAPQNAPSKVRRKAREIEAAASYRADRMVPGSRSSHRDLAAAQGTVWEEIRQFEDKLGRASDTGALDALYENRRGEMADWTRAFPLLEGQTGVLAFLGEVPLALDAIGAPDLYAKVHPRLLTGYVLDAMEARKPGRHKGSQEPHDSRKPQESPNPQPPRKPNTNAAKRPSRATAERPSQPAAERFMQASQTAERVPSESVGSGEYRILRGPVLGGELVNEGRMIHVSAFPGTGLDERRGPSADGRPTRGPIARPSQRRRGL